LPEIEEIIGPAAGIGTTEQVSFVGAYTKMLLAPHGGAMHIDTDPVSVGSIRVIRNLSSPWWTTRVVEDVSAEAVYEWAGEARSSTFLTPLSDVDVAASGISLLRPRKPRRRLSLDFGANVTAAIGADLVGYVLGRALERGWEDIESGWLRADSPDVIAAAQSVPDDAEWDDSDDSPRWLSMSTLSYRGGGVMRRRARRSDGE
jgi:hypothetical protein